MTGALDELVLKQDLPNSALSAPQRCNCVGGKVGSGGFRAE